MSDKNLGNAPQVTKTERTRIPMSIPLPKLSVPPIDGYHLHWFLEKRCSRALQGGYEFVDEGEVSLNQLNVATSSEMSGNSDLGSRVSAVANESDPSNSERLYLMKIKQEWYDQDQKALEEHNEKILSAIRQKKVIAPEGAQRGDLANSYVKTADLQTTIPSSRRR